jgi:hypothetical protein
MVTAAPQTAPHFGTGCNGFDLCGWHVTQRTFQIQGGGLATLIDHGPTGTIGNGSQGFTIGGNVGPTGPGVNAGFSSSWSQQDVTTVDQSTSQNGSWQENFNFTGPQCNPLQGNVPAVSSGTFLSRQGAIFTVAAGTSTVHFPTTMSVQSCMYSSIVTIGTQFNTTTLNSDFQLGPPVLNSAVTSLTIPAGGSAPLPVAAYIPSSASGLPWQVTSNISWLSVPSPGPFSVGKVIPVSVLPGTSQGSSGTLSINTTPPFAAPSVASGPILVNVSVGTPPAAHVAGVLISGGESAGADQAPTAIVDPSFYDLSTGNFVPLLPNVHRGLSTATLLKTGQVLLVGGETQISTTLGQLFPTGTAELFDPGTFSFSLTAGSLTTPRLYHSATLLDDGKVLVVGGRGSFFNTIASAELYDPATGRFTGAGTLQNSRALHYASLISQPGKPSQVVVYGGVSGGAASTTWELWDETTNNFIRSGSMAGPAFYIPQPLPLADGTLDLVGGLSSDNQATTQEQVLNPVGPSFLIGKGINTPRASAAMTALPDGGLLLTGGATAQLSPLATAEVRGTAGWSLLSGSATCPGNTGCMTVARNSHTATLLPDGRVLIVGGLGTSGSLAQSEFYDSASRTFSTGSASAPQFGHIATALATTQTTLIPTPSSAPFGSAVTLAATVTAPNGVPNGVVHFLDGQTEIGSSQLVQGQASITTTTLSIGSHSLSAAYSGVGLFIASVSPIVTFAVQGEPTQTMLSASPNPAAFQQPVTLTASVSSASGTVTGAVVFKDGGNTLATVNLANGSAATQISNSSTGPHTLSASFNGSNQWAPSAGTTTLVVRVATTTSLQSSPNPSQAAATVTFTATVTGAAGATSGPTGSVIFTDQTTNTTLGSAELATANGAQTALLSTTALTSTGPHVIQAAYQGDTNFSASRSAPLTQTISGAGGGKVTPKVDLAVNGSISGATVSAGDTVTFVARIHAAPGYPSPNGSITISDSTNANNRYGSAVITQDPASNDGLATITNAGFAAGNYTLLATYGGDNEGKYYNGAPSNTVSLAVNPTLGGPPPLPSIAISAATGGRQGTLVRVSLTVTNNSNATASGIKLNEIALRTLTGTGDAVLTSPSLPVEVASLKPGASTVLNLELQVPTTVQSLNLSEHGSFQNEKGATYQVSQEQVVLL